MKPRFEYKEDKKIQQLRKLMRDYNIMNKDFYSSFYTKCKLIDFYNDYFLK